MSLVAQRKVIRISVTSGAKKVISRWAAENDMKEIGVASWASAVLWARSQWAETPVLFHYSVDGRSCRPPSPSLFHSSLRADFWSHTTIEGPLAAVASSRRPRLGCAMSRSAQTADSRIKSARN